MSDQIYRQIDLQRGWSSTFALLVQSSSHSGQAPGSAGGQFQKMGVASER